MTLRLMLLAVVGGAGCSLIYNPNNLPDPTTDGKLPPDAPDAQIILDADPNALELMRVTPAVLFEGTGTGGGRSAVVVVEGAQMVPGATIEITPHGGVGTANLTVHNDRVDVSADGNMMAVPVTLDVDPNLDATEMVRLDVTVRQPGGSGEVVKTLSAGPNDTAILTLRGLDELDDTDPATLPGGVHEFSSVTLTGNLGPTAGQTAPIVVRARGSIAIGGNVDVSASVGTPGPTGAGGGAGGDAGLADPGDPGQGAGRGNPSGGGGGFGTNGSNGPGAGGVATGDPGIKDYALNKASGGAGGDGKLLGPSGGNGGAGGGAVELTAGGTLTVTGTVSAKGGNAGALPQGSSNPGGGGSGGVIVLRSAATATATVDASGGAAGTGGTGVGAVGRVRVDSPTPVITGGHFKGPMFAADTPLIVRTDRPTLAFVGEPLKEFKLFFENEDRSNASNPIMNTTSSTGQKSFTLDQALFRGLNHVCLFTLDANLALRKAEAENCIDIVYLYTP